MDKFDQLFNQYITEASGYKKGSFVYYIDQDGAEYEAIVTAIIGDGQYELQIKDKASRAHRDMHKPGDIVVADEGMMEPIQEGKKKKKPSDTDLAKQAGEGGKALATNPAFRPNVVPSGRSKKKSKERAEGKKIARDSY